MLAPAHWAEQRAIADWRERHARKRWLRYVREKGEAGYHLLLQETGGDLRVLVPGGVKLRRPDPASPLWAANAWFLLG